MTFLSCDYIRASDASDEVSTDFQPLRPPPTASGQKSTVQVRIKNNEGKNTQTMEDVINADVNTSLLMSLEKQHDKGPITTLFESFKLFVSSHTQTHCGAKQLNMQQEKFLSKFWFMQS